MSCSWTMYNDDVFQKPLRAHTMLRVWYHARSDRDRFPGSRVHPTVVTVRRFPLLIVTRCGSVNNVFWGSDLTKSHITLSVRRRALNQVETRPLIFFDFSLFSFFMELRLVCESSHEYSISIIIDRTFVRGGYMFSRNMFSRNMFSRNITFSRNIMFSRNRCF